MAQRKKKHPKLPNGYGSIKLLSGNRTNPYAVYPSTTEFAPNGSPKTPKAICYVDDWYKGFYALMAYKSGTYNSETLREIEISTNDKEYDIVSKIIGAYNNSTRAAKDSMSFSKVYEDYFDYKYNRDKTKIYSISSRNSTASAYKNCSVLHNKSFQSLRTSDLQKVIDDCPLKHASKELIVTLFRQMYAHADMLDICEKDYSAHVKINTLDDDEKGVPFSKDEIDLLWDHKDNEIVSGILIMIYSGYRIGAYKDLEINLENNYFRGGVKTKSSKDRIVPINSLIKPLISKELKLFNCIGPTFRVHFNKILLELGIASHTPHDCRHTFSWLCDMYKVDDLTKKMLLGHSLGSDVTNARYGHRTIEELSTEIQKIKHW